MIYLKATGLTARSFNELDWESHIQRDVITGTTLRGYKYETQTHGRRVYNIIISADEIATQTDVDFFESFFTGTGRQISFDGTNYIDVMIDATDYPVSYVENIKTLHEVSLTLYRVDPVTTRATGETQY